MKRLNSMEVVERLKQAIVSRRPYSALRLGDGEGRVMGFPDHCPLTQLSEIWKTWFGHSFFSDVQIRFLQTELQRACLSADLIGLPIAKPDLTSDFGRVEALLYANGYANTLAEICNSGFHLDIQHAGLYPELFRDISRIHIIGPRDVSGHFRDMFGVPDVSWIRLPPEMRFSNLPAEDKLREILLRPHFTEVFSEIIGSIIPQTLQRDPGAIVLVGGGILGKLYCAKVKALGGVAIDLGSMMDLWAGLKTRANSEFDNLVEVTA